MNMGAQPLLVAFAEAALARAVSDGLREEGYRPKHVLDRDWLDARLRAPGAAALCVVVLGDPERWSTSLEAVRTQLAGCRSLCIVRNPDPAWAPKLLDVFTDVVAWPCARFELRAHLLRTLPGRVRPVIGHHDDEFASLNLIGQSVAFLRSTRVMKKIAATDASVLIKGETGTGKELAARATHYLGARRAHPFVPVNCGAIPDTLLESELFGHERGAFTDAKEPRRGVVAQAHRGTLFLDEVDSLSPRGQVVLLRFLQDYSYRSVGAERSVTADVRIIAATNGDMRKLVAAGAFRRDLLFRLSVLQLRLPPLRARKGDVERLAEHFLDRFCAKYAESPMLLDPSLLAWMRVYEWPGNVRELENFVHRAVVLSDGATVRYPSEDEPWETAEEDVCEQFQAAKTQVLADFERRYLTRLLAQTGGNVTVAARRAGKERRAMGRLLKKHGIRQN